MTTVLQQPGQDPPLRQIAGGNGAWRFQVLPKEAAADMQEVWIDEPRGIAATVGVVGERLEIVALSFGPPADPQLPAWDEALVRSWLAANGFDGTEFAHERGAIQEGKAKVRDEEDFWVIESNGLTREGAFNRILRPGAAFRKSWRLYDGVPITHPHPPGLVESMQQVGGFVRAPSTLEEDGKLVVTAEYWLAKRPVDGLMVSEHNVRLNEETVKRVRAGKRVDNSQGFQWRGRRRQEGDPANEAVGGDYDLVLEELIPNHLAILLDEEGACPWTSRCGVGRLAAERVRTVAMDALEHDRDGQQRKTKAQDKPAAASGEDDLMAGCDGTCDAHKSLKTASGELERLRPEAQRAQALEAGQKAVAKMVGLKEDASCDAIQAALAPRLERLKQYEAAELEERTTLAKECAAIAIKMGEAKEVAEAKYARWNVEALRDHLGALQAIRRAATPRGDPGRFGSPSGQEAEKKPRTVGYPRVAADGTTTWS